MLLQNDRLSTLCISDLAEVFPDRGLLDLPLEERLLEFAVSSFLYLGLLLLQLLDHVQAFCFVFARSYGIVHCLMP